MNLPYAGLAQMSYNRCTNIHIEINNQKQHIIQFSLPLEVFPTVLTLMNVISMLEMLFELLSSVWINSQ